jgi:hypothetical protein
MKCSRCNEVFGDPFMSFIGQSMCPECGNILEFTDIISNEHYEEEDETDK